MNGTTRRLLACVGLVALMTKAVWAQQERPISPDGLKAEILALRSANVAWREIEWKPCLLDGLKESRELGKPVLLWIFIDRPADDARC